MWLYLIQPILNTCLKLQKNSTFRYTTHWSVISCLLISCGGIISDPPPNLADEKETLLQCDQIWWNFATLAKKSDYLAIFLGLVGIWQHFEPTLANQLISIGQVFMFVKAKYWKMILPSGHTALLLVSLGENIAKLWLLWFAGNDCSCNEAKRIFHR